MPFKSKEQMRACWAAKDPKWNCKQWSKETPNISDLPESTKEAICKSFQKIAKELFDPKKTPPVPSVVIQKENIDMEKEDVRQGASPSEHRLNLTRSRTGILSKNRKSNKASASYN